MTSTPATPSTPSPSLSSLVNEAKARNPGLTLLAAVPAIEAELQAARVAEREACAKMLSMTRAQLSLMAGEMSAQEARTALAVLEGMAAKIRAR